jgi:hypothetical protein
MFRCLVGKAQRLSKWFSGSRWQPLPSISFFFGAIAAYLVACLIFGGGTREGFLSDVALQGLAVPLLLWAAWRLLDLPSSAGGRQARAALLVCLLAAALPLAQLVPLPPSVWKQLPARADFESNLLAAGLEVGWLPLSVAPSLTWLSALALMPPMVVFLGILQLGYAERRRVSLLILITGLVGVVLGLLQVAQGPSSPLRFYAFTNTGDAVGFFANRNHYAALLYCLLLIAAAWVISTVAEFTRAGLSLQSRQSTPYVMGLLVNFTVLVVLVAAQAMTRSRAGLALTFVALLGGFALAARTPIAPGEARFPPGATTRGARRVMLAAMSLAVLFGAQFALYRIQARFADDPLADWRLPFARNTIEAAIAYMPFGSGMGTFVPVYQAFEKAADNVASAFANRAHNDYLELWLEAGLVGVAAMIGVVVWILWASWRVWRRGLPGGAHRDDLLACAASGALLLLLAHAAVDYALRTSALMAVFAWAVAMGISPIGALARKSSRETLEGARSAGSRTRRRSGSRSTSERPAEPELTSQQHGTAASDRPFVSAPLRDDWPAAWRAQKPGADD